MLRKLQHLRVFQIMHQNPHVIWGCGEKNNCTWLSMPKSTNYLLEKSLKFDFYSLFSVRLVDEQTEMTEKFLRFVETCLNRLKRPLPVTSKKHQQHPPIERPRAFTSQISGTQLQVGHELTQYLVALGAIHYFKYYFIYLHRFIILSIQLILNIISWWLDSKHRSLTSEATAPPIESRPLPFIKLLFF